MVLSSIIRRIRRTALRSQSNVDASRSFLSTYIPCPSPCSISALSCPFCLLHIARMHSQLIP